MNSQTFQLLSVDIECRVTPDERQLWAQARLTLSGWGGHLPLLLNRRLTWASTQVLVNKAWQDVAMIERPLPKDSFLKEARLWEFPLPPVLPDAPIQVQTTYTGTVVETRYALNQIGPDFVELSIYGVWYPVLPQLRGHAFTLQVRGPVDWMWLANGTSKARGGPIWLWESTALDLDVTLLGMPGAALGTSANGLLWGPQDWVDAAGNLEHEYLAAERALVAWLGPVSGRPILAYAQRDTGGWYIRNDLIVTQGQGSNTLVAREPRSAIQGILHEVLHTWFRKTSIEAYHNWLDEALAEYISHLVLSDLYGEAWFEQQMDNVQRQLERQGHLPAIRTVLRSHPGAEPLYYKRGALLFHTLRRQMGASAFRDWVAAFAYHCLDSDQIVTEDLIASLPDEKARWTATIWLDYEGVGVPG